MRKCVDCGKLLTGHNKAIRCKSCGNKFSYLVKNGHYATRLMKCVNCGIEFYEYDSNKTKSINGVCCSRKCKGEYQTKLSIVKSPIKTISLCVVCKETKPIEQFYKDKRCRANGYIQYTCKNCIKIQRTQYYDCHIEEVNDRVRNYYSNGHHRSNTGSRTTEENKAWRMLNNAVRNGEIIKPCACSWCKNTDHIRAHHWNGYDKYFDVIWLCPSCHHSAHGRGPKARLNSLIQSQLA